MRERNDADHELQAFQNEDTSYAVQRIDELAPIEIVANHLRT